MKLGSALDAAERGLRASAAWAVRPRVYVALVVALILLGIVVRLPLVFAADDIPSGHNDSNIYFNQVYYHWLDGDNYGGPYVYPDPVRGSGWQLILWGVLSWFGVDGGDWVDKHAELTPEQTHAVTLAYATSAMLSAGVGAATFILARLLLPPLGVLATLVLVAFDPYLLFISTSAMSEPPYTVILVLGVAAALKVRDHPAWLLLVGALMAGAQVLRINGFVMLAALLAFALILPQRVHAPSTTPDAPARPSRIPARIRRLPWKRLAYAAGAVAVFFALLTPYLMWRAEFLPGAWDYGTNQRFWADDLWSGADPYWQQWSMKEGAPKETMADYFARHTIGDAVVRLYTGVQYMVFDVVGVGKWPPLQTEGGTWPGTAPDGAILTPLILVGAAVALFAIVPKRRELWFLPLAFVLMFATLAWMYPLVRSVRYFAPFIPLFAIFAVLGWRQILDHVRRPALVAASLAAVFLTLYGARVILALPSTFEILGRHPEVLQIVLASAAAWVALALAPFAWARVRSWRASAVPPRGARDDAE